MISCCISATNIILTFWHFCKYLLFKIENMEVFIVFEFSDKRIFVIKMCSQFNVSVSSMNLFFSFAKNNENVMCISADCRWPANILLWSIGRVSLEIASMIVSLKKLHYTMVRVWKYQNSFVKCWPYCLETQQIGFGTLIDFEITYWRYFADKILGDEWH